LEKAYIFLRNNTEMLVMTFLYFLITSHAQNVVAPSLTIRPSIFRDMTRSIHIKEKHVTALGISKQEQQKSGIVFIEVHFSGSSGISDKRFISVSIPSVVLQV